MAGRGSIFVIYRAHPSVLLLLTALFAAGCEGRRPGEAVSRPSSERDPKMTEPTLEAVSRFDHIIEMLWDMDQKVRETGMKDLAEFQNEMKDPGSQIGLKALRAAARPNLFEKPEPGRVSAELVAVACSAPHSEYIPVVVEHLKNEH